MALRPGGRVEAASHWVAPTYDAPSMTTRPSHHGCPATHSTESKPSGRSCTNGSNVPSEAPLPRTSCSTRA